MQTNELDPLDVLERVVEHSDLEASRLRKTTAEMSAAVVTLLAECRPADETSDVIGALRTSPKGIQRVEGNGGQLKDTVWSCTYFTYWGREIAAMDGGRSN